MVKNYTYLTLNVNGWMCNVYYTCRIYNSCSCAIILTHVGDEMLDGGGGGGGGEGGLFIIIIIIA